MLDVPTVYPVLFYMPNHSVLDALLQTFGLAIKRFQLGN
jgi:hypothetical protein